MAELVDAIVSGTIPGFLVEGSSPFGCTMNMNCFLVDILNSIIDKCIHSQVFANIIIIIFLTYTSYLLLLQVLSRKNILATLPNKTINLKCYFGIIFLVILSIFYSRFAFIPTIIITCYVFLYNQIASQNSMDYNLAKEQTQKIIDDLQQLIDKNINTCINSNFSKIRQFKITDKPKVFDLYGVLKQTFTNSSYKVEYDTSEQLSMFFLKNKEHNFKLINFESTNFSKVKFKEIYFEYCVFSGSYFFNADLSGVQMYDCDILGCDFSYSNLFNATIINTEIKIKSTDVFEEMKDYREQQKEDNYLTNPKTFFDWFRSYLRFYNRYIIVEYRSRYDGKLLDMNDNGHSVWHTNFINTNLIGALIIIRSYGSTFDIRGSIFCDNQFFAPLCTKRPSGFFVCYNQEKVENGLYINKVLRIVTIFKDNIDNNIYILHINDNDSHVAGKIQYGDYNYFFIEHGKEFFIEIDKERKLYKFNHENLKNKHPDLYP